MPIEMPTRRSVMLATAGLAVGLAGGTSTAVAQVQASGVVFHDRHGFGRRRAGDPGLEGVLVSNGCEVVRTDTSGRFQLPVVPGSRIFVIKPPNWSVTGDRCAFARGVPIDAGTGFTRDVPDLDFGLMPTPENTTFDAVLIADTQPATAQELGFLRDGALTEIANTGAAFAINHGDVVFDDPALYAPYLQLTAATGMPWHHCPGNHDINSIARAGDNYFETFETIIGPTYYAFQHGAAVFFALNNVERLPPGQVSASGYDYRGAFGERQLRFVRNVLTHVPRETLVVVSTHIPLVGFENPLDPAGCTADAAQLMHLLSGRPHTVSFAGHTHTTEHHYIGTELGFQGPGKHHHHVLTTASGSWWSGPFDHFGLPLALSRDGSPKGFHLLHVEGNRYTSELVPVGHSGHPRARIAIADAARPTGAALTSNGSGRLFVQQQAAQRSHLIVNVFDGGPLTIVSAQIGAASQSQVLSLEFKREFAVDACIVDHYGRNRAVLKSWVEPSLSSHLWTAALPTRLPAGIHRITVAIANEYGKVDHLSALLEVGTDERSLRG